MPKTLFVSKTETVSKYVDTLCRALEEDYKQSHLRSMERMHLESASEYTRNEIQATKNGTAKLMRFRVQSGRKYYKIIQQDYDTFQDRNEYRDGSVHAFVEKTTGDVYKPAGWAKPAKYVRFDMRIINQREQLHNPRFTDWAGGYLYLR